MSEDGKMVKTEIFYHMWKSSTSVGVDAMKGDGFYEKVIKNLEKSKLRPDFYSTMVEGFVIYVKDRAQHGAEGMEFQNLYLHIVIMFLEQFPERANDEVLKIDLEELLLVNDQPTEELKAYIYSMVREADLASLYRHLLNEEDMVRFEAKSKQAVH